LATNASACTSILPTQTTSEGNLEVFPNPSSGQLQITMSEEAGPYTFRLFDLLGRSLIEQTALGNQAIAVHYKGIEILDIQIGQKNIQKKIVFE
jgi:Secretion system C-terminal sorting domain